MTAAAAGARLAFFTPLPPQRSGIARYAAELLPALRRRHAIDVYTDRRPAELECPPGIDAFSAHDFVWKQARTPYDLVVYQLGNATCHDYMWAYLTRYPGLVVLHDGQLHQSRARALLAGRRERRYRAEFAFDHPHAPPGIADLGVEGILGDSLAYLWPMLRLPVESARLVAAHDARLAGRLRRDHPAATVERIRMGVGDPLGDGERSATRAARGRKRLGLAPETIVFAAFGGMTPEKRLRQILRALAAVADTLPSSRLLLIGAEAGHYDVMRDAGAFGVADRVVRAGYVDDAVLGEYLAAADVCLCLRWPSGGETSASWLRCLAAGKPTVVTDLPHLGDVPALVTRGTWTPSRLSGSGPGGAGDDAVTVSVDLLDEDRSLAVAMRRLGSDAGLRRRLGGRARAWWRARHRIDAMAEDYERVLALAAARPAPALPADLLPDGAALARGLLEPFGIPLPDAAGRAGATRRT